MTTQPAPAPTPTLQEALDWAIERLDSEEHRYVERYYDCPNGCEFDNNQPPRRLAGPERCDEECFYGTLEDEDAHRIDPLIEALKLVPARLAECDQA